MLVGLSAVIPVFLLTFVFSSPTHDELQDYMPPYWAHQEYRSEEARRLARTSSIGSQTCAEVHSSATFEPLRIGWEFRDVDDVPAETLTFVNEVIMAKSASYWMQALNVRRAIEPLRVGQKCTSAVTLNWGAVQETSSTCLVASAPTCGEIDIPSSFFKSEKVCSKRCAVGSGNPCSSCDYDKADCPADCSSSTAIDFGSDNFLCEECNTVDEGVGAADVDLYLFATIKDTSDCGGLTVAYAGSCVLDQCDRPIFGFINFCKSSITVGDESIIATGVHEISHVLGFTSSMFKFFRNSDGSGKVPRDADGGLQGEIRWSCTTGNNDASWNDGGSKSHVDIGTSSIGMIKTFDERGIDSCDCPIDRSTLGSSCLVAAPGTTLRVPSCVFKMITPKVLEKVREHFDCPTLNGAEIENQPTSTCSIFGSHWEQRLFNGELMSAVKVEVAQIFVSSVTLALFEDSGWYQANYSMADSLVKGVHWGYHEGCSFVQDKCFSGGVTSFPRNWCSAEETSCCFDRLGECKCGVDTYTSALPASLTYFTEFNAGKLAEPDYCPFYSIQISNRICTKSDSSWDVAPNANFMRETFASNSRCMESTLRGDYPSPSGGNYPVDNSKFASSRPGCYQIFCNEGGASYDVVISDGTVAEGTVKLGTCSSDGQALTVGSLSGQITCVDPAIFCGAPPSKMFTAKKISEGGFIGKDAGDEEEPGSEGSKYTRAADKTSLILPLACLCVHLIALRII